MEKKQFNEGTVLAEVGQPIDKLYLILEGNVTATFEWGDEMGMQKGQVIGIAGLCHGHYRYTAKCATKVIAAVYPYAGEEITTLLKRHPETRNYFTASITRQLLELTTRYKQKKEECNLLFNTFNETYNYYVKLCEGNGISVRSLPHQEDLEEFHVDYDLEPWAEGFHKTLYSLISKAPDPGKISLEFFGGYIIKMGRSIFNLVSISKQVTEYRANIFEMFINEERLDLFELVSAAFLRVYVLADKTKPKTDKMDELINLIRKCAGENPVYEERISEYEKRLLDTSQGKASASEDKSLEQSADLRDSIGVIMEYVGYPDEEGDIFKKELQLYKKTSNKSSTEDVDRKRRMVLSKHFYQMYNEAVLRSLDDENIPRIVKMFLNFGYVDEELAGVDNAAYLYNIVEHIPTNPGKQVFTFYQWLQEIYKGHRAPCRNEFDNDYFDYINELKRNHKISPAEANAMTTDTRKMVIYEMENLLPSANKVTNGRITTFCPVFSEHNILKSLKQMMLSADILEDAIGDIVRKDFGAFCRESVFSAPENGIQKEMITTSVLPDVILLPNVGSRGIMWQEIEGKKRGTPGRFMLSLFQAEDLTKILSRLVAEFRWEMCKRIQGARWNDASERSLTSDYSDYIASYRKNNDLSSDVKEKIKNDLGKCKNRTKEMFILDYYAWLQFESNGSPRLNKVVRAILFAYCPFSREIREKLKINPFYTETVERYETKLKNSLRYYDNLAKSLRNKGHEMPPEVIETRRIMEL